MRCHPVLLTKTKTSSSIRCVAVKESEHLVRWAEGGGDHVRADEQHGGPGERGGLRLGIQRQRPGKSGPPLASWIRIRIGYAFWSPWIRICNWSPKKFIFLLWQCQKHEKIKLWMRICMFDVFGILATTTLPSVQTALQSSIYSQLMFRIWIRYLHL